jgi:hypothetical protein
MGRVVIPDSIQRSCLNLRWLRRQKARNHERIARASFSVADWRRRRFDAVYPEYDVSKHECAVRNDRAKRTIRRIPEDSQRDAVAQQKNRRPSRQAPKTAWFWRRWRYGDAASSRDLISAARGASPDRARARPTRLALKTLTAGEIGRERILSTSCPRACTSACR